MAEDPNVRQLEMRIVELENQLKTLRAARQAVDISSEEMKAYMKVRDALQIDWGEFCGINDCMRCIIFRCGLGPILRCWQFCDIECGGCGPCACEFGRPSRGGGGRFGGLGG
jgi:hypothetical protein